MVADPAPVTRQFFELLLDVLRKSENQFSYINFILFSFKTIMKEPRTTQRHWVPFQFFYENSMFIDVKIP
jgi:hypothetical protein